LAQHHELAAATGLRPTSDLSATSFRPVCDQDSVMEFGSDQLRTGLRPGSSRFELSRHVEIARTCSNMVADRFKAKFGIPLRYPGRRPGRRPAASWNLAYHALSSSLAGLRPASDLSATRIA